MRQIQTEIEEERGCSDSTKSQKFVKFAGVYRKSIVSQKNCLFSKASWSVKSYVVIGSMTVVAAGNLKDRKKIAINSIEIFLRTSPLYHTKYTLCDSLRHFRL